MEDKDDSFWFFEPATEFCLLASVENENVEPVYEEITGWKEDITMIKTFNELPQNFRNYINFLEDSLDIKIKIVSVGPDRKQTIFA